MLLQNFGYNSAMVRSGEEALEFVATAVPALVITELVLPGLNGIDLFNRVIKDPATVDIPVIILTRLTDLEIDDRCRRAGVAGCLNKPVQTFELYRAVQQTLEPTPRQNIRVPVNLNASLEGLSSEAIFVTMLSDSGLFMRTLHPRPAGSEHTISFFLADRIIRVDAIVLYGYGFEEGPHKEPGMGMKFLNLSPVDKDVIQNFIREQVSPGITPDR
jgi:CheY-like chemotaxis protein